MTWQDEAGAIVEALKRDCRVSWDGKEAIQALRSAGYQWKQMEWPGWYFEFLARQCVREHLNGRPGPTFGNTVFDCQINRIWDFKAHPANGLNGWMILNDREAIDRCIAVHGGVGFIVAVGDATYDVDGTFKAWHDKLKGGVSQYERTRVARGAPSRRRKTCFRVSRFVAFYWDGPTAIAKGRREGWLGEFQEGMRNSGGQLRRAKYKVRLTDVAPATVTYV